MFNRNVTVPCICANARFSKTRSGRCLNRIPILLLFILIDFHMKRWFLYTFVNLWFVNRTLHQHFPHKLASPLESKNLVSYCKNTVQLGICGVNISTCAVSLVVSWWIKDMHSFGIRLCLCFLQPLKHAVCNKCHSAQWGRIFKMLHKTPIGVFLNITKITISNSNVQIEQLSWFQLGKWEITKRPCCIFDIEMA